MRLSGKWKITGLLLSIAILLNGCMAGKPVQDELGEDAPGSLKIWYPDVEPFHTKYGQMLPPSSRASRWTCCRRENG